MSFFQTATEIEDVMIVFHDTMTTLQNVTVLAIGSALVNDLQEEKGDTIAGIEPVETTEMTHVSVREHAEAIQSNLEDDPPVMLAETGRHLTKRN